MFNDLFSIFCVFMCGGIFKGLFFLVSDLLVDIVEWDCLLLEVMGLGYLLQIDGIGGGNVLISKVVIIDCLSWVDVDVDYLFVQVWVEQQVVDILFNCGNMLVVVGLYVIECGLVQVQDLQIEVCIYNVNIGKLIIVMVEMLGGNVVYRGDMCIVGVLGLVVLVRFFFFDVVGVCIGKLLFSGYVQEIIDGVLVSLVDCVMLMMLVCVEDLGVCGDVLFVELNMDVVFMCWLEVLCIEVGVCMGIVDVGNKVIFKLVLLLVL